MEDKKIDVVPETTETIEKSEVVIKEANEVSVEVTKPMGFEDEEQSDMIIPRVKCMQALNPEVRDREAKEGNVINSLTKDVLNGLNFIPVFKFNNNIEWKDRDDGGGILCSAADGKLGNHTDGSCKLCKECKRNEFDNTKTGKESYPSCTKYINYLGFFEGERMPIILSFSKTNMAEGKKLYSLAKVSMQNMWNFSYTIESKLKKKAANEWYIIDIKKNTITSEEDRLFAKSLFDQFRNTISNVKFDVEEATEATTTAPEQDVTKTEY